MAYANLSESQQQQLREWVGSERERYSHYHDQKETMAYAGLTVFLAAAATVLTSKDWPPAWAEHRPVLTLSALTVLWSIVLLYLRFQLRNRRWAAYRVAGCDRLLLAWLPDSPRAAAHSKPIHPLLPTRLVRFVDYLWPLRHSIAAIEQPGHDYPPEVEHAFVRAEVHGTGALRHERLIMAAGWLAYAAMVLITLFGPHSVDVLL